MNMYIKNLTGQNPDPEITDAAGLSSGSVLSNEPLTEQEQASLTPQLVIDILKQGNKDFTEGALTVRNNTGRIRKAALCQYPKAVILSCMDSRVPVEDIFHRGIGDLFVVRIAGNFVNEDVLGSLEFACKVSGAKLIVVLGHEHCGAIKAAIDNVEMGNITTMLSKIRPAVTEVGKGFPEDADSSDQEFVATVCLRNIENAIRDIRSGSPLLSEMENKGEIGISGAVYHMETGEVVFL